MRWAMLGRIAAAVLVLGAAGVATAAPAMSQSQTTGVSSSACTLPGWRSDLSYYQGARVSHVGHNWVARTATWGSEPGRGGLWGDLGSC